MRRALRARFATEHYQARFGLPKVGLVWQKTCGWDGPEGWKLVASAGLHRFVLRRTAYR